MSGGDCRSRQLRRGSPTLTDSLPPPESWNVGEATRCLLCRPQQFSPPREDLGASSEWTPYLLEDFSPSPDPLVKPRTAGEPPVQGSHFPSPSQAAHAMAPSWDAAGSLLVPARTACRKESVGPAVVSSSLESQAVPWGPSPHCQHGSSTPVLSRVSGDTPRGLGKETLKAAIGTSLRVSPVRGKTASSSSCLASKHTWNSDDCRHPGHVPQVTGQPLTYPTRGQAGCKDRALKVCFGPQGLMGTAVSLKCQRRDFYSGPQRPEIS